MSPDREARHAAAEDERNRARREKRIRDEATAEAHALAKRNAQALLANSDPVETDFEGCTT